jgi:hypothetical protein
VAPVDHKAEEGSRTSYEVSLILYPSRVEQEEATENLL